MSEVEKPHSLIFSISKAIIVWMDRIVVGGDNASYSVPRTVHEEPTCTIVIILVHLPPTSIYPDYNILN